MCCSPKGVGAVADVRYGKHRFPVGVLFRKGLLRRSLGSLSTFGAFAAVVIYGGIMNPAAATAIFLLLAAEPMLEKLDRIKVKYGLVE